MTSQRFHELTKGPFQTPRDMLPPSSPPQPALPASAAEVLMKEPGECSSEYWDAACACELMHSVRLYLAVVPRASTGQAGTPNPHHSPPIPLPLDKSLFCYIHILYFFPTLIRPGLIPTLNLSAPSTPSECSNNHSFDGYPLPASFVPVNTACFR